MDKVINFLKQWGILILVLLLVVRSCSLSSKVEKLSKENLTNVTYLDSLVKSETISIEEFKKIVEIEGLRSEKRMIQSTDRKMLDVSRQTEIDNEIKVLESK
jgi:hypothetical protein